jgi:hypothetical protein
LKLDPGIEGNLRCSTQLNCAAQVRLFLLPRSPTFGLPSPNRLQSHSCCCIWPHLLLPSVFLQPRPPPTYHLRARWCPPCHTVTHRWCPTAPSSKASIGRGHRSSLSPSALQQPQNPNLNLWTSSPSALIRCLVRRQRPHHRAPPPTQHQLCHLHHPHHPPRTRPSDSDTTPGGGRRNKDFMGPAIAPRSRGHAPARPITQKNSHFLNFMCRIISGRPPNQTKQLCTWVYESGGNETKKIWLYQLLRM